MLVLTRRAGESIMVNDLIEVKVLRIKGKQVHIGIDAPSSTAVHRKEVWARINSNGAADHGAGEGPASAGGDAVSTHEGADA